MLVERETFVSLFIATVAILVVVGGFAAFSGLSVSNNLVSLDFQSSEFQKGDVFDVYVDLSATTLLYDESLTVYIDDQLVSTIPLKKYFDENSVAYGQDEKSGVQIISLSPPVRVNLADIPIDNLDSGTHRLDVYLSQAEASASGVFRFS